MSMREVFELLEKLAGKKIPRKSDGKDTGLNAKIEFGESVVVKLG
jgi:hypothetical protein